MQGDPAYRVLADLLLVVHVAFVLFVIVGLLLVLAGGALGWRWVRHRWFRLIHLFAIGFVAVQAWLGRICPLTTWEMALRARAGEITYGGGFIEYWLGRMLSVDAPPWVFTTAYTAFALVVVASWWFVPPDPRRRPSGRET